jgi:hypothetical protein
MKFLRDNPRSEENMAETNQREKIARATELASRATDE